MRKTQSKPRTFACAPHSIPHPPLLRSVLTAEDPNCAANYVVYVYKDKEYKKVPPSNADHLAFHFSMDGSIIHVTRCVVVEGTHGPHWLFTCHTTTTHQ